MTSTFKNKRTSLERIEKFISPIYFTESNLYGKLYSSSAPLTYLAHFAANGRLPFKESVETGKFIEAKVGLSYGPTWSTHWFKLEVQIPDKWLGKEVRLRWESGCEGLLWSQDGHPLQGFSEEERTEFVIAHCTTLDDLRQNYYVEMACNTLFGAGKGSMIAPPDPDRYFVLQRADIVVVDRLVFDIINDLDVLMDIAKNLPDENPRAYSALYTANSIINIIQIEGGHTDSYMKAKDISKAFFSQKNGEAQHTILAIGNCHIDCAWLWPYEETVRKCARSWASTVQLLEKYPDFKFACSQAQQFMWVKENYPFLYDKVKYFVSKGRFIPVGGTWVEMDGNLPSGESFVRQFLYGQRFFEREFGKRCKEFWLPDTFGYSAQLPQIMRMFNIERFLTQKLSWNLVNKFPHDTFLWQGLDGSNVLAHMPSSYTATITAKEAIEQVANFKDKGRSDCSMMLFGHGDGGGGPTEAMLERQIRLKDCDAIPKIKLAAPEELFSTLEDANRSKLCCWNGELFLELHQGTYTTQAKMKQYNRECEFALRCAEFLHSMVLALDGHRRSKPYPQLELERLWKILLLNQFHDVLPGSSIAEVHKDALYYFMEVLKGARNLQQAALVELFGLNVEGKEDDSGDFILVNSLSWVRTELVVVPWTPEQASRRLQGEGRLVQTLHSDAGDSTLVAHTSIPMGYKLLRSIPDIKVPVTAEHRPDGTYHIRSQYLHAVIDSLGHLTSLHLLRDYGFDKDGQPFLSNRPIEKEAIQGLGNDFVIFDDIPLYWDAWDVMDYHLETGRPAITEIVKVPKFVEWGPLRVCLKFRAKIGKHSRLHQKIIVDAIHPYVLFETRVNWNETHKFLKVKFPLNVLATEASYDIQFGHVKRPTHYNTSWDAAKFEVYGHKWADLSEHDWGVSLLNTSKYGYSVHDNKMSLSLLRAPRSPDPHADQGEHKFSYAIMPHTGTFQQAGVIQQAYQLHAPVQVYHAQTSAPQRALPLDSCEFFSWFQVSNPAIVIDTIKKAEDRSSCLLVRLFECYGSRCNVTLRSTLPLTKVIACNGLEDPLSVELEWKDGSVDLHFKPFQIQSLLMYSEV